MPSPSFDTSQFFTSLQKIYKYWQDTDSENNKLKSAKLLTFIFGNNKEESYSKSSSLHKWLFGYELTDTVLILSKSTCHIITSKKKVDFLSDINENKENKSDDQPKIQFHIKAKGDNQATYQVIKDLYKKGKIGVCYKDLKKISASTEFTSEIVKSCLPDVASGELIDITNDVGILMGPKTHKELSDIAKSAGVTCNVYNKIYRDIILRTIDAEKKVKHSKISDEVKHESETNKEKTGVVPDLLETAYQPIIQSGGNYSLKFSTESDDSSLHYGGNATIICMIGMRYRSYCTNIARVLLVNPNEQVQSNYNKLLELHEFLINCVKPGKRCNEVYEEVLDRCPDQLRPKLTKTFGSAIGIEFKETGLTINSKCQTVIQENMTFNLSIGFSNLENPKPDDSKSKIYSLFLADTIQVNPNKELTSNTVLTKDAKSKLKRVKITISNESSGEEEEKDSGALEFVSESIHKKVDMHKYGRGRRNADMKGALKEIEANDHQRQLKQAELLDKMNREAYERLTNVNTVEESGILKRLQKCYEDPGALPWTDPEVSHHKICIDKKPQAVIVPIGAHPYALHISMFKNVTSTTEGEWEYLRVNLYYPGSTLSRPEGANFHYPEATYLKEFTFRASVKNSHNQNLQMAVRMVRELQKRYRGKEQEEKEKKGLVKQDKLLINPNFRTSRLKDLYMRPSLGQKRLPGILEAHSNGFRYQTVRQDRVDILYNNIKHAIFQPCDNEMIMVLHFQLKNFILIAKRKVTDIQFYIEVGEMSADLMKGSNIRDRDDIYAEQKEREHKKKLKAGFKNFIERVESYTKDVEFDRPYRDLGFDGVPHKVNCMLQPTTNCLINVTEWPTFVCALDEIECVNFERVSFGNKTFDMIVIYKDYSRKIESISSIPRKSLDAIKTWLHSCSIRYTEGPATLQWATILKTIRDDPEGFFEQGGWNFLDENDANNSEDEELEKEEDEDFEEDVSETQSEDFEDSNEDDYTDESDDDSGSNFSGSLGSDESEGKDWDELEAEAKANDKEFAFEDDEEDDNRRSGKNKKSKHSSRHRAAPPSKKRRR